MKKYNKYKESNVAWLGEIPEHWDQRFLFQCATERKSSNKGMINQNLLSLSYGRIIRKNIGTTSGLLPDSFETYQIVQQGDIIMRLTDLQNDKRSLRTGLVKEVGIITSAYVCLNPKKGVNTTFFHYLLHCYDVKKLFYSLGGGLRQGCGYADLKKVIINLPSEEEQEQIVRYLDWKVTLADKFVAEKRKQIELLREEIESYCYASSETKISYISTWCPNMPNDWKKVIAKRLFEDRKIKNCKKERMLAVTQDRGIIYKDDCSQNYVSTDNCEAQKIVKLNDFVLSLRSFQGGIEFSTVQGLVSPAYNIFYLKSGLDMRLNIYYRFLFKSKPFVALLNSMGGGIRDGKNISFNEFSKIELPVPPDGILCKIEKLAKIYDAIRLNLPKSIELIEEYKTSLISDVVTGKVDIRDIKITNNQM